MGLISGLWLSVLGILGAASIIVMRNPKAKDLIGKMAPYQGWIGAVSAIWGAFSIVTSVLHLSWLATWPIYWATYAASAFMLFALGLLLGVGVLKTFIKNREANERMDRTIARLMPYQAKLGFIAMGVGAWMIVSGFLFHVA
jgi:hypothetical protein